jgi:hypothetical protein
MRFRIALAVWKNNESLWSSVRRTALEPYKVGY